MCVPPPCPLARLLGTLMAGALYSPLFKLYFSTFIALQYRRSFCALHLQQHQARPPPIARARGQAHIPHDFPASSCFAPAFATTEHSNAWPRSPAYFPRADPRGRCGCSRGVRHEAERRDRERQPQHTRASLTFTLLSFSRRTSPQPQQATSTHCHNQAPSRRDADSRRAAVGKSFSKGREGEGCLSRAKATLCCVPGCRMRSACTNTDSHPDAQRPTNHRC